MVIVLGLLLWDGAANSNNGDNVHFPPSYQNWFSGVQQQLLPFVRMTRGGGDHHSSSLASVDHHDDKVSSLLKFKSQQPTKQKNVKKTNKKKVQRSKDQAKPSMVVSVVDRDSKHNPYFNTDAASLRPTSRKRMKSRKITIIKHPVLSSQSDSSTIQEHETKVQQQEQQKSLPSETLPSVTFITTSATHDEKTTHPSKQVEIIQKTLSKTSKRKHRSSNTTSNATNKHYDNNSNSRFMTGGGKEGASLRRIQREWKDAVKLGIAYDWHKKLPVQGILPRGTRHSSNDSNTNSNPTRKNTQQNDQYNYVRIGPMGKNLLRWHFSVQGPSSSVYSKGVYHGRILLPKDYPLSPPRVQMFTPSGRFIPGEDICLSASAFHPETWTPRWTILSLVDALRMHMLTTAKEIGGMEATFEKREKLALDSRRWKGASCVDHGKMIQDGIFGGIPSDDHDEREKEYPFEERSETSITRKDDHDIKRGIKLEVYPKKRSGILLSLPIQLAIWVGRLLLFMLKHPMETLVLSVLTYVILQQLEMLSHLLLFINK